MARKILGCGLFLIFIYSTMTYAQRPFEGRPYREVGLNVTGLLTQLVPFNRGGNKFGPHSLHLYLMSKKNRGLRVSLGANVTSGVFGNTGHLNILVGFERRKWIGEKFVFRRGIGGYINGNGFNSPIPTDQSDEAAVGIVLSRGIEYHPWDSVSFFTEAHLFFGSATFGAQLFVLPPVAISANVKL